MSKLQDLCTGYIACKLELTTYIPKERDKQIGDCPLTCTVIISNRWKGEVGRECSSNDLDSPNPFRMLPTDGIGDYK